MWNHVGPFLWIFLAERQNESHKEIEVRGTSVDNNKSQNILTSIPILMDIIYKFYTMKHAPTDLEARDGIISKECDLGTK